MVLNDGAPLRVYMCILVRVSDDGRSKRKVVVEITPHSLRLLLLMHYCQSSGSHTSAQR